MPTYLQSILNGDTASITYDCIEFSHPDFDQTYYVVRNSVEGLTVTHEDMTTHDYVYVPIDIKKSNSSDDLDQTLGIAIADLSGQLAALVYKAGLGDNSHIRPLLKYRAYLNSDLASPLQTLQALEVHNFKRDSNGNATFEAKAPELNSQKTGEVYTLERFPMLRALL